MKLITKYLDEDGSITNFIYRLEIEPLDNITKKLFFDNVLSKYNGSLLYLRGISSYANIEYGLSFLRTDRFSFKLDSPSMNIYQPKEPCDPSVREGITRNLELELYNEQLKTKPYAEYKHIRLIPLENKVNEHIIYLNEIRSSGIYTRIYQIAFEYSGSWSDSCNECVNGMMYLRKELDKMSDLLYCPSEQYEVQGKIVQDLAVNDYILLKSQISILLKNALESSRVESFNITDITEIYWREE